MILSLKGSIDGQSLSDLPHPNIVSIDGLFNSSTPFLLEKNVSFYFPFQGIIIPDDPIIGCECTTCDVKNEKNCCPGKSQTSLNLLTVFGVRFFENVHVFS